MTTYLNRDNLQVRLATRPKGWVRKENFYFTWEPIGVPEKGEVLVKAHYLSLDPYMRGRMNEGGGHSASVELGGVMIGDVVGQVVESRDPVFQKGDHVVGLLGWQQYGICQGRELRRIDTSLVPETAHLGAVGRPGVAAWYGFTQVAGVNMGETVVVSAASGAVGSVVGQLAKMKRCRAVGIAGGRLKCRHVVEELGFDACVDYKGACFYDELVDATPRGVDVYYDNVGGEILDAVLSRLNPFARIALCGLISGYNDQPMIIHNVHSLLRNRVKLEAFIIADLPDVWGPALKTLGQLVGEGRIKYRETIAQGLENAPSAFIAMLKGDKLGKQIVKVW